MPPPEPPRHLPPKQVITLASILTLDDGAFVVGGQALNLWAERYQARTNELSAFAPYTSKDLDFYGHRAAAEKLANALGGEMRVPSPSDATPNSALVIATVDGRRIEIDFLASIIGVRHPERLATEIVVPIGPGRDLAIPVMHPLDCLLSRVANVRGTLRRTDNVAMRQFAAAPIVLREYISEMLDDGEIDEATDTLQSLFKYLRSNEYGRQSHTVLEGVDPLTVIAHFQDDTRLDQRYRDHNIQTMLKEIGRRRAALVS